MRKGNIFKNLILFLTLTLIGTIPTFAEDMNQTLILQVDPLFTIEKKSSVDITTANAETGVHSGIGTVYEINTNGTDKDYYVTISSSLVSDAGILSAYGSKGCLLFAKEDGIPPIEAHVKNARLGIAPNDNVIAYPVTASITSPMEIHYYADYAGLGSCYAITLNGGTKSTLSFNVGGTPVANTYSNTRDQAGAYKATITITVTPKL